MVDRMVEKTYNPEEIDRLFRTLAGSWEGTNKTWFEPGKLADTSAVRGTIRTLPGNRFILYEYASSLDGQAFQGMAMYGYNSLSGLFDAAWADSFHMQTHIMSASGPGLERGFSVLGSYRFDATQPAWGWRTQVELLDANTLTITAFNIPPGEEEAKAIESAFQRVRAV
jgi:hypothetical protein